MFSKGKNTGQESIILFILPLVRKAWTSLHFKLFLSVCVGLFFQSLCRKYCNCLFETSINPVRGGKSRSHNQDSDFILFGLDIQMSNNIYQSEMLPLFSSV